jgi:hypothetical protein
VTAKTDPATSSARASLYLGRGQTGRVLNRVFTFYSGAPTTPNSYTGNLALGASSGGPGAALINGVGPARPVDLPCDEPTITALTVLFPPGNVVVEVVYSNPAPDDVYVLYSPGTGQSFGPTSAPTPIPGGYAVPFPDVALLPAGSYSFKVLRASNPRCLSSRAGLFVAAGAVCPIEITDMRSPFGFPVIPPGPPGFPGGIFLQIDLVGSGFLTGPLTLEIINNFFPFNTILPDSVTVVDDNNLMFSFTGTGITGSYRVRVSLTADASCFDEIGDEPGEPFIALQFA